MCLGDVAAQHHGESLDQRSVKGNNGLGHYSLGVDLIYS